MRIGFEDGIVPLESGAARRSEIDFSVASDRARNRRRIFAIPLSGNGAFPADVKARWSIRLHPCSAVLSLPLRLHRFADLLEEIARWAKHPPDCRGPSVAWNSDRGLRVGHRV